MDSSRNIKQVVPFFMVTNMEASLDFYIKGIGFELKNSWLPDGKIRWCWLQLGGAALMLQEYIESRQPSVEEKQHLGKGTSLNFICEDALAIYHDLLSRGLSPKEPFVGNDMWVVHLIDPDGYHVYFESNTDVPEETMYSDWVKENI
ncbi:MAG: VOC family protein [Bacteroidetes bacterium]|nr:VOC family protein [Bacteroidota bacterium]